MADNSLPKTPERDLNLVTYEQVKEIRVVDTSDNSKTLAINNLTIAGTKVTVAVDGLSGTVDGAFGDVLTAIAEKADTTQVEALDDGKIDKTAVKQVVGTSETDVMSQNAVTDNLELKIDKTSIKQVLGTSTTDVMSQKGITDYILPIEQLINEGYTFMGVATPTTELGTPDQRVFYIVAKSGEYPNFDDLVVEKNELAIFKYDDGTWIKEKITFLQQFLFAENCPFIKELYLNEQGVAAGIAHVHLIYPTWIRFSNSTASAFVARTLAPTLDGIVPIYDEATQSIIYGYIIIDTSLIPSVSPTVSPITPIAQKINYSPAIKYLLNIEINDKLKKISADILLNTTNIYKGDYKTMTVPQTVTDTNNIYFQYPKRRISKIDTIEFYAGQGTINFYKVTYNEGETTASYELITSITTSSFENSSFKRIKVDVELAENQFIGINGKFYFGTGAYTENFESRYFSVATSIVSNKSTQQLAFRAYNEESLQFGLSEIGYYQKKTDANIVLLNDMLTSQKDYIVGTQSFGSFGLNVNDTLRINKYYSVSNRTIKFVCKFGNNTIAKFGSLVDYSYDENSVFTINVSDKTVRCKSLETYKCPILQENAIIVISITKWYEKQICEISNLTMGKSQKFEWVYNGTGGSGTGVIGTLVDTGMQWDYYFMGLTSGAAYQVQQIVISAAKCDLLIYGDSITEGEAYWPKNLFNQHWVQLVVDRMKGRALGSGRSGTSIDAVFKRIVNELPYIKPKYVMITIGTNGGIPDANYLGSLVDYVESQGSICILNHIPANDRDGVSNHIETNATIDQIRAQKNIKGADFDIVTSINNNPTQGVQTEMMWQDDNNFYLHPNVLGSRAMFEKLMLDIPEIFE